MSEKQTEEKPITEQSEKETSAVKRSDTSKQETSPPEDSKDTVLRTKLLFVQQTLFDFQEVGGKVSVANIEDDEESEDFSSTPEAIIVLSGVKIDDNGSLVLAV